MAQHAIVYKICARGEWQAAEDAGTYAGSADDLRDGFIHFSLAHQLRETARKYFAGRGDLVLIAVDTAQLGEALRYEASRGGDLFPHLYAPLPTGAARWVEALPWEGQAFRFPRGL
jgi:uncharacterized protein (DUF952 family)